MNYTRPTLVNVDGFHLATYPHGPEDGPPVVLIHGWPELAYSWKNTVPALVDAGYRVVAYDLLGFGRSDVPRAVEHYTISNLVAHLEAVMDYYSLQKATLIGHDWGGIILWHAVRILEARVKAAVSVCTPHVGQAPVDPMTIFEKRYGMDHYFLAFRDRTEAVEKLFNDNPEDLFAMMFRKTPPGTELTPDMTHLPKRLEDWLAAGRRTGHPVMSKADLKVYVDMYARTGFLPGMNYYRNTTANWAFADGLSEKVRVPCLMISPEDDIFLPPRSTHDMDRTASDLTRVTIPACGHWAMWDAPEALNAAVLNWLSSHFPA